MRKSILATSVAIALGAGATVAQAAMDPGATLNFTTDAANTKFNLGLDVPLINLNGIVLGTTQAATGSHAGVPTGSESPNIDQPWTFFGNTGMDQTTIAPTIASDDGAGNVTLNFTGWDVTWNGIPSIPMGGDTANFTEDTGIATVTCGSTCGDGDTFTLSYTAHVPVGDPSNFGGAFYALNLTGTIANPAGPAVDQDEIIADLGSAGVWAYRNNTSWELLNASTAQSGTIADLDGNGTNDLIIDFGAAGLFARMNNSSSWSLLNANDSSADEIGTGQVNGAGATDLVTSFGSAGLWAAIDGGAFAQINPNPANVVAIADLDGTGGNDIIADFGSVGTWVRKNNGSTWNQININPTGGLVAANLDDATVNDLVIDYEGFGLWTYRNDGTYTFINANNPNFVTTGDLDGNGVADIVADFGAGKGIWAFMNNSTWQFLNANVPEDFLTVDLNGAGGDDLVVDFGTLGLWAYVDNTSWTLLSGGNADSFESGDVDGGGVKDLIASFGSAGIFVRLNGGSTWTSIGGAPAVGLLVNNLDAPLP